MDLRQKKLLPWQNILSSRQIAADIEEKLAIQREVLLTCGGIILTFPYQTNGNHATESSTVGDVISEQHWTSTFDILSSRQIAADIKKNLANQGNSETVRTSLKMF